MSSKTGNTLVSNIKIVLVNACVYFTVYIFISYLLLIILQLPKLGPTPVNGIVFFVYFVILSAVNLIIDTSLSGKSNISKILIHFSVCSVFFIISLIVLCNANGIDTTAAFIIYLFYAVLHLAVLIPSVIIKSKAPAAKNSLNKQEKNKDEYNSVFKG